MTLAEIIAKEKIENKNIYIEYRTYLPDNTDIFFGGCYYKDKEEGLISIDGDDYYMTDEFIKYEVHEFDNETVLTCWYESEWI